MSKYSSYLTPLEEEPAEEQAPLKSKYVDYLKPVVTDDPSVEDQTEEAMPMEGVAPEGVRDLTRDDVYARIAPYMKDHFGMTEGQHGREKVVESYVNHMRKFAFGQSVTTFEELAYLNKLKGTKDQAERTRLMTQAASAYDTFDSMKGAFSEGTSSMEKLDAVGDYARALIVDPMWVVGLGIGKLAGMGASKAAGQVAKQAAKSYALSEVKKKGVTEGVRQAYQQQERMAANKLISSASLKAGAQTAEQKTFLEATKKAARREAIGVGLTDTVAGVGMDAIYQNIMTDVDLQDGYNMMQGGFAALGGAVGLGVGYSFARGFNLDEADLSSLGAMRFYQAQEHLANARKIAGEPSQTLDDLDMDGFEASLTGFRDMMETLKDKAARGVPLRELDQGDYIPDDLVWQDAFFKGISTSLADNGVKYWTKRDPQDGFLNWMSDLMVAMPDNVKDQLSDIFDETLGANVELYKGKKLFETATIRVDADGNAITGTALELVASEISDAAKKMAIVRNASSVFNKIREIKPDAEAGELIEELIKVETPGVTTKVREGILGTANYMQRNLIRMLVTHPGTTALNLVGWSTASSMQSATDIVRGTLFGGAAILNAAMFNREGAASYAKKAGLMFSLQKQKARNLLDPNMTYEAFQDILAFNPQAQKDMLRYMAGGVDIEELSRTLQLEEFSEIASEALGDGAVNTISRNKLDKIMDKIQLVYGVKLQDIATKSQEFMYAVDKQMRIKYNMSYKEFLQDPDMWKKMMGDDYAEVISAASQDALRNVFSKSYADANTTLGKIAGMVEEVSRLPLVGAMIPFGQFFNNTIAHMMDHSGISLTHRIFMGGTRDVGDLASKTAVGLSFMGAAYNFEKDYLEEGLKWYESRASDGSIRNRLYDFPYIFYKAIGRMAAHIHKDGTIPEETFREIVTVLGPGNMTRQLDDTIKGSFDLLVEAMTTEDVDVKEALIKVIQGSTSMYASGYTRFLDPVNLTAAMVKGEAYIAPDRKQGSEWVNKSVRYADELLESMELYTKPGEKYNAITTDRAQVPISKVFGIRFSNALSSTEKAFGEAGIPDWKTDIRSSIPEARNEVQRIIAPILEYEFASLIESSKWKAGTPAQRKSYIYQRIRESKALVKDILSRSFDPKDTRTLMLFKLGAGEYANKARLKQYAKEFGIEKDLNELEDHQLKLFVGFVEVMEDQRLIDEKK